MTLSVLLAIITPFVLALLCFALLCFALLRFAAQAGRACRIAHGCALVKPSLPLCSAFLSFTFAVLLKCTCLFTSLHFALPLRLLRRAHLLASTPTALNPHHGHPAALPFFFFARQING